MPICIGISVFTLTCIMFASGLFDWAAIAGVRFAWESGMFIRLSWVLLKKSAASLLGATLSDVILDLVVRVLNVREYVGERPVVEPFQELLLPG